MLAHRVLASFSVYRQSIKSFGIPIKKPVLYTDDVPKTSVSINGETALYLATVSKYLR